MGKDTRTGEQTSAHAFHVHDVRRKLPRSVPHCPRNNDVKPLVATMRGLVFARMMTFEATFEPHETG